MGNLLQIRLKKETEPEKDGLSLMTYNVNIFDIYNDPVPRNKMQNIMKLIGEEKPDILCLQEFVHYTDGSELATIDKLDKILNEHKNYVEFTTTSRKISHFGSIIYSRYPIIDKGKIEFNKHSDNICLFIDILYRNDTIRIYNVHLQSIRMKPEDYRFAEDISNIRNISKQEKINHNLSGILTRLKHAFILRAPQADMIKEHMNSCSHKILVCGDFNDTPSSYAYNRINKEFKDAFVEKGTGLSKTYSGVFPSFRIDYIMYSKDFEANSFNTLPVNYSDHYPVICLLKMK
jgi:endonuclease/exonuclease/phosphatase family metal-dependent hydrolase